MPTSSAGAILRRTGPDLSRIEVASDWHEGRGARSGSRDLVAGAAHYKLPEAARLVVDTALALGEPLLVTGESGTGKTQLAYWLARQLSCQLFRFQTASGSQGRDLLYTFDNVAYFRAANVERGAAPDPTRFREKGPLWRAVEAGREARRPQVLLIDEIDLASRDFPNDLLAAVDELNWPVPETREPEFRFYPNTEGDLRPVVIITSNDERRLPAAFLRRCLYLRLELTPDLVLSAITARAAELGGPSKEFVQLAVQRFLDLRDVAKQKPPTLAEALVWMRALHLSGIAAEDLAGALRDTPHKEALIKDLDDLEAVGRG